MDAYLEIEFYSGEPSKLYIKASNGYFSGCTETYINESWLSKMASELKEFPKEIDSVVEFESNKGEKDNSNIYLKFYCIDKTGHTALNVSMKTENNSINNRDEAKFILHFEAAELDKFSISLENTVKNGNGSVCLTGLIK